MRACAPAGEWVNVYTSASPIGPFTYRRKFSSVYPYTAAGSNLTGTGDMLIYPDGDDCYLIYNSR